MLVFELICITIVALTLAAMAKNRPVSLLLQEYALLVSAAWLCENTSIRWYEHYAYSPDWHLFIDRVPILIPMIWPLVILSAREVVASLGTSRRYAPLLATCFVFLDASMVEVIATNAGLWAWAEPGHLNVPVIGILGWCYFAFSAAVALQIHRLAILPLAFCGTHLLLIATWWGGLRFTLRSDLGLAAWLVLGVISGAMTVHVWKRKQAGYGIPLDVALPRIIAAFVFIWLLVTRDMDTGPLWLHTAIVAVPYLVATQWQRSRRAAHQGT